MSARRHRIQLVVPLVVVAMAVGAVPAHAHTPATFEFKNGGVNVESRADGIAENSKQVIEIPGLKQLVCPGVSYKGTVPGVLTTSIQVRPTYTEPCEFLGVNNYRVLMGECVFVFNANGQLAIVSETGGDCNEFPIRITNLKANACEVFIPEQVLTGVTYTTLGTTTKEVTASIASKGISGEKGEDCAGAGGFTTGEYIKGNTILYGVEGGMKKSMAWLATVP